METKTEDGLLKKLTLDQMLKMKVKSRTSKQALKDEASATHRVEIVVTGCATSIDMDLFRAVGAYSDSSGCGFGERDHEWSAQSESDAVTMKANLETMMAGIEALNNTKIKFTITIRKK